MSGEVANGAYVGGGIQALSANIAGNQQNASLSRLVSGGFAAGWEDGSAIKVRTYDASGKASVVETSVATTAYLPKLAGLAGGGFAVVWQAADGDSVGVKAELFNASGQASTPVKDVNVATAGAQTDSAVGSLSNGGFVVSWSNQNLHGQPELRFFDASGAATTGEIQTPISDFAQGTSVTPLANGDVLTAYVDHGFAATIKAYGYSAIGRPDGISLSTASITGNSSNTDAAVAVLKSGDIVLTWNSRDSSSNAAPIRLGQLFDSQGVAAGSSFQISHAGALSGEGTITALDDGGFVVAWAEKPTSSSVQGYAIEAQVFAADASRVGSSFEVSGSTLLDQQSPTVSALDNDGFVVGWTGTTYDSPTSASTNTDVLFREYTHPVINGTAKNDVLTGTAGDDVITPGGGRDIVDGGAGTDTVIVSGTSASHTILTAGGHYFVLGADGSGVELTNVEAVRFDDFGVLLGNADGAFKPLDGLEYIASNADLIAAFGANADAGVAHFLSNGFLEGRQVATFDAYGYLASNPDLLAAFGANTQAAEAHYITNGRAEGRTTTGFDVYGYLASNPDLLNYFGTDTKAAEKHYVTNGHAEGRATASFDALAYAAASPDLAAAFGTDAHAAEVHYIDVGLKEGRPTSGFDSVAYLLTYPDLEQAGLTASSAFGHWLTNGADEGRVGDALYGREQASHIIQIGLTQHDALETASDHDWFGVTLTQGQHITIDLAATGFAPDLAIHDDHGLTLASATGATGGHATLDFTADHAGLFYLTTDSLSGQGSYGVTIEPFG